MEGFLTNEKPCGYPAPDVTTPNYHNGRILELHAPQNAAQDAFLSLTSQRVPKPFEDYYDMTRRAKISKKELLQRLGAETESAETADWKQDWAKWEQEAQMSEAEQKHYTAKLNAQIAELRKGTNPAVDVSQLPEKDLKVTHKKLGVVAHFRTLDALFSETGVALSEMQVEQGRQFRNCEVVGLSWQTLREAGTR